MGNHLSQIRYWVATDDSRLALPNLWTICIIDGHKNTEKIRDSMLQELDPIAQYEKLSIGPIKKSGGLHHLAYNFLSEDGQLEPEQWVKIYGPNGKVHRDLELNSVISPASDWFPKMYLPRVVRRNTGRKRS